MGKQVEFFFDYGSPFSYLADTQLPAIAARHGAEIIYKPMLLGGVFKATGNSSAITIPAKAKFMMAELQRWPRKYGVPMKMNPHFPINTIKLMRGAVAAQMQGKFAAYHAAVFRGVWVEELDLGESAVLAELLKKVRMDPESIEGDEVRTGCAPIRTRRSSGAPFVRRRSSSAARCSGATTVWSSWKKRFDRSVETQTSPQRHRDTKVGCDLRASVPLWYRVRRLASLLRR